MKIFIVLSVLFSTLQVFPQGSPHKINVLFSVGEGLSYNTEYSPNLSGKLGIGYGSLTSIADLKIGLEMEVGYISASINDYDYNLNGTIIESKTTQRIIPITLSLILNNNEKILSPYIKLGFGLGNKRYSKIYEKYDSASTMADKWFFILLGGTGLSYKMNAFEISIMLDATIFKGNLMGKSKIGFSNGPSGLQTDVIIGFQGRYFINI